MIQTVYATYDGTVLQPIGPLAFAPGVRVRLTVEAAPLDEAAKTDDGSASGADPSAEPVSFLDTLLRLKVDGGPPDWSRNIDTYLYGSDLHPPR